MEYALLALIILAIPIATAFAVVQITMLKRRVDDLQRDIDDLRARAGSPAAAPRPIVPVPEYQRPAPAPLSAPPPTPPPPRPAAPAPLPPAAPPAVPVRPQPVSHLQPMERPAQKQATPDAPPVPASRSQQEWEALVGGKLLNRVGALAIILGVGFFLKYAFDNNWISETMRVLMGIAAGAGLLTYGAVMHDRSYKIFAQGIIGAGVAILYLSMYASFNYYHLVSQNAAFLGMSIVTAVTIWRGLKHDSITIGLLGWLGGFLTPYLLRTDVVNDVGFLIYVGLLLTGICGITLYRPAWSILEYLNLGGTIILYSGWFVKYYDTGKATIATSALVAYWIVLAGVEFVASFRHKLKSQRQYVLSLVTGVAYFMGLFAALHADFRYPLATMVFVSGAIYAAAGLGLGQRKSADRQIIDLYSLYAIALLVAATAIALSEYRQIMVLSGEAVILSWIAARWNNATIRFATFSLLCLMVARYLLIPGMASYEPIESFALLTNERAVSLITMTVSLVLGAKLLSRGDNRYGPNLALTLDIAWCSTIFLLTTFETLDYFRHLEAIGERLPLASSPQLTTNLTLALSWTLVSTGLITLGMRARARVAVIAGLILLATGVVTAIEVGLSFDPPASFCILLNYRAAVWIIVGLAVFWTSRLVSRTKGIWPGETPDDIARTIGQVLTAGWCMVAFCLTTFETIDYFRYLSAVDGHLAIGTSLELTRDLTIALDWILLSVVLFTAGFWRRNSVLLVVGLLVLTIGFIFGLAIGRSYEPVTSYQLLLNYRTGVLAIVGIALFWASRLLSRVVDNWPGPTGRRYMAGAALTLTAGWCLTIFLLSTYEILDYFRHLAFTGDHLPISASPALTKHLTLALSWTLISGIFLTLGVRSRAKVLIISGLSMLTLGLFWTIVVGRSFEPVESFSFLLNYRAIVFIIVGSMIFWTHHLIAGTDDVIIPVAEIKAVARVSLWALGLYFLTAEVWDIFDCSRALARLAGGLSTARLKSIENMQQLTLSGVWLFYSAIMMALGIWKQRRPLRLAAFALFGVTILKIFLRDLTFLTGLYRILSFMGLGIILLAVSFAYQRFKGLIFGTGASDATEGK